MVKWKECLTYLRVSGWVICACARPRVGEEWKSGLNFFAFRLDRRSVISQDDVFAIWVNLVCSDLDVLV